MIWQGLKVLAVVPARGGSKGIPRKNLRIVGGKSLIGHAAALCAALPWLDRAVVSTEDEEIAAEAEAQGLAAPFRRPPELAGDAAGSIETWQQAWRECERLDGCRYDVGLLLEPTSPLRCREDVERCLEALARPGVKSAATVSRAPGHFTPHKTLTVGESGHIGFYLPDGARYSRRQGIPAYYFRNGLCYAVRRPTLMDEGHIIEDHCAAVVVERPIVNIDDPFDLELAEFLFQRRQEQ